jgi:uncharacterized protein (DUF427 family)/acyl-CoA thioesterase
MAQVESAWERYPDYEITVAPVGRTVRVWRDDLLVAESDAALLVKEENHVDRVYLPEPHVRWEHFEPTEHHTVCPFKGEADYWTLTAGGDPIEHVVWTYRTPFDQVGGIEGHVAFYQEHLRIELVDEWSGSVPDRDAGDPRDLVVHRFPVWGDARDLVRLIDVQPVDGTPPTGRTAHFVGEPYPTHRNVVEGGQLLAEAVVAASKTLPNQRVTSATMIFAKAASFDMPLDVNVDILRGGRTFSTVEVRIEQEDKLRSVGLLLLDSGAPDLFRSVIEMPDVGGPYDAVPLDMRVTGRDIRIVDDAYSGDPDRVGPPEVNAWIRFKEDPGEPYLHAAVMTQPMTHWTIAAGMRPHPGFGEDQAHVTLSTGPMSISVAYHDEVDVTEWLLYANPAVYAGRGLVQGEGHVFTEDGRLVATYSLQAMVRAFDRDPSEMGMDFTNAM